jgi:hypothetical protein
VKYDVDIDPEEPGGRDLIERAAHPARHIEQGLEHASSAGAEALPRRAAYATGGGALVLLALALGLSPERYVLIPLALLAGLVFARLPEPGLALAAFVPYAALANLEGIVHPLGLPYPSEVILLSALAVLPFRDPALFGFRGAARWALAFGLWMAVAALAGASATDSAGVTRLLRIGFLAAALFALGHEIARRGRAGAIASDAGLGAAAGMAILGLGEGLIVALQGRGPGAPIGSAVGGPELLALHLTLLVPPGLALATLGQDRAWATRFLLLVSGLALLATGSRAGWAGGWAAILGMGLLGRKVAPGGARRLLGLCALLLALSILGAAVLVFPGSPLWALGERLRELTPRDLLAARRADWQVGIETIRSHPIFGQPDAPNPYNLFLGLAATSGLPILAPWGALLGCAWAAGLRAIREQSGTAVAAVGLAGAAIGLVATGIGESTLGSRLAPPAFLFLGLLQGVGPVRPAPRGGR